MTAKDQTLVVIGVNHRSSGQTLHDRFAVLEADTDGALEALLHAGASEGVLIATCDRVELVTHDAQAVAAFALSSRNIPSYRFEGKFRFLPC